MAHSQPTLVCHQHDDGRLIARLAGDWLLAANLPAIDPLAERLTQTSPPSAIDFETSELGAWDTGLVATLVTLRRCAETAGVPLRDGNLPAAARRLLALAFAVREPPDARRTLQRRSLFERTGTLAVGMGRSGFTMLTFVGAVTLSFGRLLRGRATLLPAHIVQYVQESGAEALPIVSLITFLIGMIFAFVGVMQLEPFGVGIFTADLVAIAMIREMSPVMTAIIMAGRTGAAYAAEIGTMKVNEEVDALTTLGFDPVDFLVTPRVLALTLMMPLLSLYGSLLGILGGMWVGVVMLDVGMTQYVTKTVDAVDLHHLWGGLFKSLVYGSLVAMAGCHHGMNCGNSALAVGRATTKAVVTGIVLIVVSASVLTVIYINLGV